MLKYENNTEGNAKFDIKHSKLHYMCFTRISTEDQSVISKMLEALNLKNNAETRYRCQVSVYRTIGPLVFLTSPNDYKLFHLIVLNEFVWQKSHSAKTPSTSRVRIKQDRNAIKTCFHFHM